MKEDTAGAGRKSGILWVASLVATALITLFLTMYFQNASITNGGGSLQKQALLADMRLNLVRSVEKEKSAVLSNRDEESAGFAEQSVTASREVTSDLKKLEALVAKGGSEKEKELVGKFGKSWEAIRQIDTPLLESAMQNTNSKALDLSNTIGADLQGKIDSNLTRLTRTVGPALRKTQMEKMAVDARLAVRTIALLQVRHITSAADADKKKLAATMRSEQKKADAALKTLDRMTGKKSRPYISEAITDFEQFMRVNDEIVRLSTLNTNLGSAELSLGRKRLAEAECDRTLQTLQKLDAGRNKSGKP